MNETRISPPAPPQKFSHLFNTMKGQEKRYVNQFLLQLAKHLSAGKLKHLKFGVEKTMEEILSMLDKGEMRFIQTKDEIGPLVVIQVWNCVMGQYQYLET